MSVMTELSATRYVAASPATVWDIVTDLDSAADTLSAVSAVQRLDNGAGFGVGTRWRETRTMFGKEATEELAVTAWNLGNSYTVESDSHGTHYRSVMGISPSGEGTELTMTFVSNPQGLLAKILGATIGRFFEGATRKALQQDLDDIAARAERQA